MRKCPNERTLKMKKAIRKDEILSILNKYNYVTVEFLSKILHVSQSSIRRDLMIMETQQLVKRSHGGVHAIDYNNSLTPYELRMQENISIKREICQKAINLVNDGDTIFIDGSTTCLHLPDLLEKKHNITVLTNSLRLAAMFEKHKNTTVYCTGGLLRLNELVASGAIAHYACELIHTNIMFFSARAINKEGIITDINEPESLIRKAAIKNTDKAVFLCDSTKFEKTSTFTVCNANDISYIVTDKAPDNFTSNWKNKWIY